MERGFAAHRARYTVVVLCTRVFPVVHVARGARIRRRPSARLRALCGVVDTAFWTVCCAALGEHTGGCRIAVRFRAPDWVPSVSCCTSARGTSAVAGAMNRARYSSARCVCIGHDPILPVAVHAEAVHASALCNRHRPFWRSRVGRARCASRLGGIVSSCALSTFHIV